MARFLFIIATSLLLLADPAAGAEVLVANPAGAVGHAGVELIEIAFSDEGPLHTVTAADFYIGAHEITWAEWQGVVNWAVTNGYTDLPVGEGISGSHPVTGISWYDAVKWCNARSEMEGFEPAYFLDTVFSNVYRTGEADVPLTQVRWAGRGYRLPTEREWELAARGGLVGQDFPWAGDSIYWAENISPTQANYASSSPLPPGQFATNEFGLYDVAGNVAEWCWDWYDAMWYLQASNRPVWLPRGPRTPGLEYHRAVRGGSWRSGAADVRVAARGSAAPGSRLDYVGLRVVRTDEPPAGSDVNNDGLDDRWTIQYFSHAGAEVAGELAGSLMHTVEEAYITGLDPVDPEAVFEIHGREGLSGNHLTWPSSAGRIYRIYRAENLQAESAFVVIADNVAATPPVNEFIDPYLATFDGPLYYMIAVRRAPAP